MELRKQRSEWLQRFEKGVVVRQLEMGEVVPRFKNAGTALPIFVKELSENSHANHRIIRML